MYRGFSNKWTLILAIFLGLIIPGTQAVASCGAVNCFIVIPSQASIPQKGTVTTNITYQNINRSEEHTSELQSH